jgi:hypothetical protein
MIATAALLLAVIVPSAAAQYVGLPSVDVDERAGTPASKPEARNRVGDDPRRIFQKLTSTLEAERRTAAQQLSWPTSEVPEPFDARLLLVNLDADDEKEVIFVLSGSPLATVALVFDRQKEGWWRVGEFSYWWHWDANQAERFIELREIVKYGRKDIIVREQYGGTGVATTQLSIYRLHSGRLYRVFVAAEDEYHYIYGSGATVTDTRRVEFPEADSSGQRFLVVYHRSTTEPDIPTKRNPITSKSQCSAYRWDANRFTFVLDGPAASGHCKTPEGQ